MSRKERRTPGAARLRALLEAGDHRRARAEARTRLADPGTTDAERADAAAVLSSLDPERGALVAGVIGAVIAAAIATWTILAG